MRAKRAAKILVVEDETFRVKIYAVKLKKAGYDIAIATDGEEAVRLAGEIIPDLILLDLLLPKMDGFKVLEALRAAPETKDIRVMVLSNLGQEEDVKRALALGANAYLIKADLTLDEVMTKIRKALEGKNP